MISCKNNTPIMILVTGSNALSNDAFNPPHNTIPLEGSMSIVEGLKR